MPGESMQHLEAGMERINATFLEALRCRDPRGLASLYHSQAKLLVADGEIVTGRQSIEAFYTKFLADGFQDHEYERLELDRRGDMAFEIAEFTMIFKSDDVETRSRGKHMLLLRLCDGEWQVYVDTWNYSPGEPS